MTMTYFPFDAGPGSSVSEAQWAKMASLWAQSGVLRGQLNKFAVTGDSTGMQVKVATGKAWVNGFYCESDAIETVPIAAADPVNPRYDIVVLRLDRTANTITLAAVTGTPAAVPVPPFTTRSDLVYELLLARVSVVALAATIAPGDVSDMRVPFYEGGSPFGSGKDGDVVITGTTVLNAGDKEYNTLRIASGGVLKPNGATIRVREWLMIQSGGTLSRVGGAGGNSSGGTGGTAGSASESSGAGLHRGTPGTAGVSMSGATSGKGAPATPIQPPEPVGSVLVGMFGAGNGGSGGGGTGTTVTAPGTIPNYVPGTAGGKGGDPPASATLNGGGGGGGGGGCMIVYANHVTVQGSITVIGGNGGNGGGTSGGGGGGSGGLFYGVYRVGSGLSAFVTGGTGGTGAVNGANGSLGTTLSTQIDFSLS